MTSDSKSSERNFTLLKVAVLLALLLILVIAVLQERRAAETADLAVPLLNAPQPAAGGGTGLSGVAEPGSTVELRAGDTLLGSVAVGADGTWSYEAELAPGEHEIVARTLDPSGKVAAESEALTVSVPAESPETVTGTFLPMIQLPELPSEGGLRLEGSGAPGSTVELWAGANQVGAVIVGSDGTWSFEGELAPGDHEIVARTVDTSGRVVNESEAVAVQVSAVAVGAGTEAAGPELVPPKPRSDGGFDLSGSAEAGSTVELWDGDVKLGEVIVGDDGAWSFNGELAPGGHVIVARTVDASGQVVNESEAVAVQVSAVGAEAGAEASGPELAPPEPRTDGGFDLSGSAEAGSTVELWDGDVKLGEATAGDDGVWSFNGKLAPGGHVIVARTVDASGQVLGQSGAVTVTVSAGLLVAVPRPDEAHAGGEGTVTLTGTGDPGATMEIVEDGVVVGTAIVGEDGLWTFSYAAVPGEHELAVRDPAKSEAPGASVTVGVAAAAAAAAPTDQAPAGQALSSGGQAYVVQQGDWLKKIARKFYDDSRRWRDIMEATNAKAAKDASFSVITDPDLIRPGWKLWIPAE